MPSLDGYSLNEKMDRIHNEISSQIEQLQKDFHNLYGLMERMKEKSNDIQEKSDKKSSSKKVKKEVAKEIPK